MAETFFLFFWLIFAIVVAVTARSRGRSGLWWFLLSVLFTPVLMMILVLVLPNHATGDFVSDRTHVRCPDCREPVRRDAIKCKHCGSSLTPSAPVRSARLSLTGVFSLIVIAIVFWLWAKEAGVTSF